MAMRTRYNHAFDIAFELISDDPNGDDVTPEMVYAALERRIQNLKKEGTALEAIGAPFDTYEFEEDDEGVDSDS